MKMPCVKYQVDNEPAPRMELTSPKIRSGGWLFLAAWVLTLAIYWPGLSGSYLFDDYPNIVDNKAVQPPDAKLSALVGAALSSPSSEFKRPLASLSFAANYLATGLNPYWMKLTNLLIHLLNGLLVFLLTRVLLLSAGVAGNRAGTGMAEERVLGKFLHSDMAAALIATGWMILPINLTAVLYVVQRMESMANLFVLLGLIGYVAGRRRMLAPLLVASPIRLRGYKAWPPWIHFSPDNRGFVLCLTSITIPTVLGILAKETAVMLPLYALLTEWALFRFQRRYFNDASTERLTGSPVIALLKPKDHPRKTRCKDYRIFALFLLLLVLPMTIGLAWLLPGLLRPENWAIRDFTLGTRLLSEARIIADYIVWTLLPTPDALSFYHDDFRISTGLLAPWTTLVSMVFLATLVALTLWLRPRRPLAALGIALFLSCQLLTGTIIPLELIYEHRNYFASFGLLLAIVPLLAAPPRHHTVALAAATGAIPDSRTSLLGTLHIHLATEALPFAKPRYALLTGLMLCWTALTTLTAYAWGNPLRLAEELATRAPQSPRAQYELGRTYIIYSNYDPRSPFTKLAYAPLERAAAMPGASILPEQALLFMNARMQLPLKDSWWDSLITKLKAHKPTIQDESSLAALTQCARDHHCDLPQDRMVAAFMAALNHPHPSARLLANYGDYAWNVLDDKLLGQRMTEEAVRAEPNEPVYHITLIRMFAAQGRRTEALDALKQLETLNIGGRLNSSIAELHALSDLQ